MNEHARFRVCAKAALFAPDLTKVLAIDLREWGLAYGLPGGHLEVGEQPDDAIRRELREELNLTAVPALRHFDFFLHDSEDKIVLMYVGVVGMEKIDVDFDSGEGKPVWLSVNDIECKAVEIGSYRDFVLRAKQTLAL